VRHSSFLGSLIFTYPNDIDPESLPATTQSICCLLPYLTCTCPWPLPTGFPFILSLPSHISHRQGDGSVKEKTETRFPPLCHEGRCRRPPKRDLISNSIIIITTFFLFPTTTGTSYVSNLISSLSSWVSEGWNGTVVSLSPQVIF